ncbi:phosphatidylinositol kinase- protein kinase tor1, partial [Coemansia sp. RSA 2603]
VCGQYLDSVVPAIFKAMESAPAEARESYIERLGRLVGIARQLIRPYLEPLFDLFVADPLASQHQQKVLIGLIEVLAESLNGDFGPHIQKVISFLISTIDGNVSKSDQLILEVLQALRILAPSLEGYLLLIMPRLILLLDVAVISENVVIRSLQTIGSIVTVVNSSNFMSRLILVLVRLLQSTKSSILQISVVDLVCVLMEQLQDDFSLFIPTINMALKRAGVRKHNKYEQYSKYLYSGRQIPTEKQQSQFITQNESNASNKQQQQQPYNGNDGTQLYVDISHLRNAWTTQHILSDDNWLEWLAKFTIELLNQSPSPALRACASLALSNPGLRFELFNPAFVSCWVCLPIEYQQEMFLSLQEVASKPSVPLEILQTILSLAGFMERDEKQIPIDIKHLAEYASRCHSLAKELHYKEAEWSLENNYDVIEKLIDLNQNMDLHDSAIG